MELVLLQDIILNDKTPSKSVPLKSNLSYNRYLLTVGHSKIQYLTLAVIFPTQIKGSIRFLPTFSCLAESQVMANNLASIGFNKLNGHFFYINLMLVTVKHVKY